MSSDDFSDDREDFAEDYARDAANDNRRIYPEEMTDQERYDAIANHTTDVSNTVLDAMNWLQGLRSGPCPEALRHPTLTRTRLDDSIKRLRASLERLARISELAGRP